MSSTAESGESTLSSLVSDSEEEFDVEVDDKPYVPAGGAAAGSSSVAACFGTTAGKVAIGAAVAIVSLVIILSVVLTLPENVTCDADVERYFIRLADPPSLSAVEPSLVCTADGARDVLLGGGGFLRFNGAEPAVSIDGEAVEFDIENPSCSAVDVRRQDVETCESMRLTLPQQDAAEFEYPNVSVVWPEREGDHATANIPDDEKSCAMSSTLVLVRVPPPDVFDIFPPAVCEQTTRELTLTGEYLLRLTPGNFQTQVAINEVPVAATDTLLRGCFNSTVVPAYTRVRNCSTIDLVVNASTLVRGLHNVSVVNPQPAGCVGRQTDQFLVVQAPVVTSIQPPIACVEQANRTVRLNGSGFLRIDGSISTVTIADIPVVVSSHGSCVDLAVKGHNVSTCGFVDVILAAADFGQLAVAGSTQPIVRVTPPFLPECLQTFATNLLTLVPPPDLFDVNPPAVCADTERVLVLSGEYFLRLALEGSPTSQTTVTIDGTSAIPFANTTLSGCTVSDDVPTYTQVESCSTISIQVRTNDYAVGLHNVSVENPQPAGCIGRQTDQFLVVEAPVVTSIEPPIACVEQADQTVRLHGSGLLQVDGVVSTVAIANIDVAVTSHGGCADLPVKGHNVSTCSFVDILLASAALAGLTDSGVVQPEVRVTPPFLPECTQTFATGLLTLVPPPEASAALPPVMCGTPQEIVIEGNYFIVLGNGSVSEQPIVTVTVHGVLAAELVVDATAVTPENCTALQVDGSFYSDSRICSSLRIAVPSNEVRSMSGALNATRGIVITNPTPAGCSSTPALLVDVLTPPTVDAVMPDESCLEGQERILLINGTDFARVTASGTILLPSVTVGGWSGEAETASGCLASRDPTVELCSALTVRIPANASVANVAGGFVDVSVLNPYPLPCASTPRSDLFATPPPLALVSASPASLCQTNATNITVRGSGFISPGVMFTFDGATVQISELSGCSDITYLSTLLRVCNTALLAFDPSAKPVGAVNIQVSNPAPFDCTQASSGILAITAPPNVTSVTPSAFCAGDGGVLTITGMNFATTSQVTLEGSGLATYVATTTFVNESVLLAEFPANVLASASYDVVVSNGAGCTSPGPGLIEVRPLVLVFFIDPPVTYNGIQLSATVYTSGLANEPTSIELVGPSNQTVVLTANSTGLPNQNLVTLPAGLEAGSWSLRVLAETGCAGMASNVLTVAGNLTVHVESITPTFAYTGEALAVTVFSLAQPPAGFVNFSPVPRLYLTSGSGTNDATPTRAVEFVDNATLTAVIPSGVAVGTYDLVVVNPDGGVGLFSQAITVVADPLPVIDAVSPNSLKTTRDALVTGANFDTTSGITTWMECRLASGATLTATIKNGTVTVVAGTLTDSSFTATFKMDTLDDGSTVTDGTVCLVVVQNNGNGALFRFSAISKKGASGNLIGWTRSSSTLVAARRRHVQLGARATSSSRFLYAIGGEANETTFLASIEAASVGPFGELGAFRELGSASALPERRSGHGGVRIGRFVYLVGGATASASATDSILRAQVLDPLVTPTIAPGLNLLANASAAQLSPGTWFYRVSALFGAADSINPGGESLPGELLTVQVPPIAGAVLELTWNAVPRATGYVLYRTPTVNASATSLEELAVIMGGNRTFTDAGMVATDAAGRSPLARGALGRWRAMPNRLATARFGQAVVASPNPLNASQWLLYAIGGRDGAGAAIASYEWIIIDLVTQRAEGFVEEDQQASANGWQTGASSLGEARYDVDAVMLTNSDLNSIPAEQNWVFVGPGSQTATTASSFIEHNYINTTSGSLDPLGVNAALPTKNLAGGCMLDSSGFIYIFGGGGSTASPSASGSAAEVCNPDVQSCLTGIPTLVSGAWNDEGTSMSEQRVFHACSQEVPFFYISGGRTGAADSATDTVDVTVQ